MAYVTCPTDGSTRGAVSPRPNDRYGTISDVGKIFIRVEDVRGSTLSSTARNSQDDRRSSGILIPRSLTRKQAHHAEVRTSVLCEAQLSHCNDLPSGSGVRTAGRSRSDRFWLSRLSTAMHVPGCNTVRTTWNNSHVEAPSPHQNCDEPSNMRWHNIIVVVAC
ncbi:hypothetical protein C8Q77DRAFT_686162 [Trametes polyzona]|nr:hypothetical protein C8Q77DRAFT_686162 [Trametes polyzona]